MTIDGPEAARCYLSLKTMLDKLGWSDDQQLAAVAMATALMMKAKTQTDDQVVDFLRTAVARARLILN